MDEVNVLLVCLVVLNIYLVYRTRCIKDEVIAEKFSNDDLLTIRDEINKQYNIDVESIRNLGAISKSLLTGTNYHSTDVGTPGQLTIPADTTLLQGQLKINSTADLGGPSPETRITSQGIIFGGANNGRDVSSAQISAGKHSADSLCLVGMSNPSGQNRKIEMWAEGGLQINGSTTVGGAVNTGDSVNITTSGAVGASFSITNNSKTSQGKTWRIYNMNNAEGYKNALEFWRYPANSRQFALNDDGTSDFSGAVNTGGQILVNGSDDLAGPGPATRITSQGIIFGGANNGRETHSAQISAGKHGDNTLGIVGMSTGTDWQTRRIEMWAEGGLQINGSSTVSGDITAGRDCIVKRNLAVDGDVWISGNVRFNNKNTLLMDILPRGIIMAYNDGNAPAGWAVCDGNNGTPNLSARFILGAGTAQLNNANNYGGDSDGGPAGYGGEVYNVGLTSGSQKQTLRVPEMPAHNHSHNIYRSGNDSCGAGNTFDCGRGGGQAHGVVIGNTGGNRPHNNMPPYYVLTYIMKL